MREIRSSGSVRGVRSNPYPYRDQTVFQRDKEGEVKPGAPGGAPRLWFRGIERAG